MRCGENRFSSLGVSALHKSGEAAGSRRGPEMSTRSIGLSVRNENGHMGLCMCLTLSSDKMML